MQKILRFVKHILTNLPLSVLFLVMFVFLFGKFSNVEATICGSANKCYARSCVLCCPGTHFDFNLKNCVYNSNGVIVDVNDQVITYQEETTFCSLSGFCSNPYQQTGYHQKCTICSDGSTICNDYIVSACENSVDSGCSIGSQCIYQKSSCGLGNFVYPYSSVGSSCSNNSDCCSDYCSGGFCQLQANGTSCSLGAECQGGYCCNSICQSTPCVPVCKTNGLECAWNSDCCSAYCRPEAPRVCADPPPVPSCSMQNLSCPAVCVAGQNFNVSYNYKNTDYLTKPYISQRVVDWNYNNLWCLADQAVYDNSWHSVTRTVPCPSTSMTIFLGGHSDANHLTNWCSVPWGSAGIANGAGCSASCQIEVIPPVIGYVKIKHPALGILSLRLISFIDAKLALKGIIKVARFNGDTNASADLVETNDLNASPVRVKTPYGIKAWRMQR